MEPSPKKTLIFKNYPDAFGDTYCVIGRVPFLYKTGPAWFQERYTWRLAREIRPVDHHHRIKPKWRSILRGIVAHFKQSHVDIPINIISGLAYGGQGTGHGQPNDTFCELLVVIGIPPVDLDYDFEKIKEAAEYVQKNVVSEAGFPDVHVAVREWEYYPSVSTSSRTSKARLLPSLEARLDIQTMGYSHPFTTNPGLAVALLDKPAHEGTVGLYLQLKDPQGGGRSKILGLTCCHFTSPSSASTGLSIARAETHPEYIITPGEAVYTKGIWEFIGHIGAFRGKVRAAEVELEQLLKQEELKQKELKQQQRKQQRKQQKQLKANTDSPKPKAKGQRSTAESTSASASASASASTSNTRTATKSDTSTPTPNPAIQSARRSISYNTAIVNKLNSIYERVPALSLDEAQNRRIGRVYYADPISASSEDPFDAYTVDWALVEFDEGAFGAGFTGNKVFIGGTDELVLQIPKQRPFMGRSNGFRSVLQIPTQWVKSKKDVLAGEHRDDKYGTNRVAVVKNGAGTGTTFGWLNGLDSYVRHTVTIDGPRSAGADSKGGAARASGSRSPSASESIVFESMETTILHLGADHGSFSEQGDSGAAILDSDGRFVALLTGSGGMAGLTDITFGTAAWKLMPRVMSAVPGVELWPVVQDV